MTLSKQVVLIDVREPSEYADHHVPDSQNVPLADLPAWIKAWPDDDMREVLFICRSGNRSARATYLARQMGIRAKNVAGGTTEWSAARYPRVMSSFCRPRMGRSPL
ncbi:rhodanese-like domain-containing protein [Streptomyces caniscabiei]|uniref:rhodanese-like domain-containing protein n=1 Tax=Streptomyces caniscabiei TaxID=2746961 RepID=UPI0038D44239